MPHTSADRAGESIGCLSLAMSRIQVQERLGPARSARRDARTKETVLGYRGLFVQLGPDSNVVDLIWTTRPGFKLANGIGIGSRGDVVKRRFPRARCHTRNNVRFCEVRRGRFTFTGFVIKGDRITEIDVGFQSG